MAQYTHYHTEDCDAVEAKDVLLGTPWHEHAHWVFGQVVGGRLMLDFRRSAIWLSPGQGFILAPETAHRLLPCGAVHYRVLSPTSMLDSVEHAFVCPIRIQAWRQAFEQGFRSVKTGMTFSTDVRRVLMEACPQSTQHPLPRPVSRVRHVIWTRANQHPTLSDFAGISGRSPWHLDRLYVSVIGLTPHQALVCAKVRQARRLMMSGVSLCEVAAACGFADQSHMTRQFKRAMGLAPMQYIHQIRRKVK